YTVADAYFHLAVRGSARPRRSSLRDLPLPLTDGSCVRCVAAGLGRIRSMRYIAVIALAFAFAGPVHGASNDPKPARQAGEPDTPRQGAEKAAQGIANPQVYWLDTAYRSSEGGLVQEQPPFLRNKK